jgi:hypothetical protein
VQTYAHYFWSYVIFRKKRWVHEVAGFSIFPDMPYFMAYLATWGKISAEGRDAYREGALYIVFNSTHSLTILGMVSLAVILLKKKTLYPMLIGWLMHQLGDHLTHVSDAYPIFWPLSDKRFPGFVSYWEPAHYGVEFNLINHMLMFTVFFILVFSWARKTYKLKKLRAGMDSRG